MRSKITFATFVKKYSADIHLAMLQWNYLVLFNKESPSLMKNGYSEQQSVPSNFISHRISLISLNIKSLTTCMIRDMLQWKLLSTR